MDVRANGASSSYWFWHFCDSIFAIARASKSFPARNDHLRKIAGWFSYVGASSDVCSAASFWCFAWSRRCESPILEWSRIIFHGKRQSILVYFHSFSRSWRGLLTRKKKYVPLFAGMALLAVAFALGDHFLHLSDLLSASAFQ